MRGRGYSLQENLSSYYQIYSLHDEEVWVVDVELDGAEEVDDPAILDVGSVDQILVLPADNDLAAGVY